MTYEVNGKQYVVISLLAVTARSVPKWAIILSPMRSRMTPIKRKTATKVPFLVFRPSSRRDGSRSQNREPHLVPVSSCQHWR